MTVGTEWNFIGVNGGFLSTIALRAAGAVAERRTPVMFQGQYGKPPSPGILAVRTHSFVRTSRTEVVRVDVTQHGAPVLSAFVRTAALTSELEHDNAPAPEVPPPDLLRPFEELVPPGFQHMPVGDNYEMRPVTWELDWPPPRPRPARNLAWFRFRPAASFADPFVDHGRSLIIADGEVWRAVMRAHAGCTSFVARSIDLTLTFHRPMTGREWLLAEVVSPVSVGGVISGEARIWCAAGELLASGTSNLIAIPRRADRPA